MDKRRVGSLMNGINDFNKDYTGTITLQANKKYNIRLDYFEFDGTSTRATFRRPRK